MRYFVFFILIGAFFLSGCQTGSTIQTGTTGQNVSNSNNHPGSYSVKEKIDALKQIVTELDSLLDYYDPFYNNCKANLSENSSNNSVSVTYGSNDVINDFIYRVDDYIDNIEVAIDNAQQIYPKKVSSIKNQFDYAITALTNIIEDYKSEKHSKNQLSGACANIASAKRNFELLKTHIEGEIYNLESYPESAK